MNQFKKFGIGFETYITEESIFWYIFSAQIFEKIEDEKKANFYWRFFIIFTSLES